MPVSHAFGAFDCDLFISVTFTLHIRSSAKQFACLGVFRFVIGKSLFSFTSYFISFVIVLFVIKFLLLNLYYNYFIIKFIL